MSLLGKVVLKLMPKKLLNKAMGKAIKKSPKVDCGIFAQAAKQKERQAISEFLNQTNFGHTEISLADLSKMKAKMGTDYGKDFVRKC